MASTASATPASTRSDCAAVLADRTGTPPDAEALRRVVSGVVGASLR